MTEVNADEFSAVKAQNFCGFSETRGGVQDVEGKGNNFFSATATRKMLPTSRAIRSAASTSVL